MPAENPLRDAARELARKIGKMSDAERAAAAPALPIVTIEGRPLSPLNSILVAFQAPGSTVVGGFRQWLKAGRCVQKGQKGLWIWVPTTVKGTVNILTGEVNPEGETTRFIFAPVFDVSQTAELPAEGAAAAQQVAA